MTADGRTTKAHDSAANPQELCPSCGGDAGNNWFDRSLCPCDDTMHTRCVSCGHALDGCDLEDQRPEPDAANPQESVAASLADVQVTRYRHGGARFFIENDQGRHLFADTYNEGATAFLEAALLKEKDVAANG